MADRARRTTPRAISWWWALWGALAVMLAVWGSTAWLLAQTNSAQAALRMDAIKTGLSVGAGTGGGVALVLAIRRQWLGERAQLHTEQDARERRITELYGKAADQLGNERAPVRLAGLYALERLAQNNPDHRQTIVDVICAYLRMPYIPPATIAPDAGSPSPTTSGTPEPAATADEELQVRLTAQRILVNHLRPHREPWSADEHTPTDAQFWADIKVNLSAAVLVDFDFAYCRAHLPHFTAAHFYGQATFSYCRTLALDLTQAVFHDRAYFHNAVIDGGAAFDGAVFHGDVNLSDARFTGDQARFPATVFHGTAAFHKTRFGGHARFDGAVFHRQTWFTHSTFHAGAWFGTWSEEAPYATSASCGDAVFHNDVDFEGVTVTDPTGPNVWPTGWTVTHTTASSATLTRNSPR
ncbi:pentapeptide repeat-containing protein [Streptomyces sp. NPDC007148]|uniref:pentapeptide repeat-containing protein n=1 Tax=unclassified Streptomyces TaxID=2593676 RepID=UPI0033E9462B